MLRPLISFSLLVTFFGVSWIKADDSSFKKEAHELADKSSDKMNTHLHDQNFHGWVSDVKRKACQTSSDWLSENQICSSPIKNSDKTPSSLKQKKGTFYIFVSLSMGEKSLLNLAKQTKNFGGVLVLRGFVEGSYKKTAESLQNIIRKTGQGFMVDPELFEVFQVKVVPTFVLSSSLNLSEEKQAPLHDRIQGHVSLQYALDTFAKAGDFKREAQILLRHGAKK